MGKISDVDKTILNKVIDVNILNIDENSIVVFHVDITNISVDFVDQYMKKLIKNVAPFFKKRDSDLIVMPYKNGKKMIDIDIIKKKCL